MKQRLPTSSQRQQFIQLIRDTKERDVRRYLVRSFQAFKDGHLEAAVVLAWAGVERYYAIVRDDIGQWYFEQHYKKEKDNREPPNLEVAVLDSISSRSQIFNDFKIDPANKQSSTYHDPLKELRHLVAHGRGKFCSDVNEVLGAIITIRSTVTKKVSDQRFFDPDKVINFLIEAQLPPQLEGLISHFPDEMKWIPVFRKLASAFLEGLKVRKKRDDISISKKKKMNLKVVDIESIRIFANCIVKKLTPDEFLQVWENFAYQALNFLKAPLCDNEDHTYIYSFIARPSNAQELPIRDQFLEYYFDWLDGLIETANQEAAQLATNSTRSPDAYDKMSGIIEDMIRKINRDIPNHLKEKWNSIQTKWRTIP